MSVEKLNDQAKDTAPEKSRSEVKFPAYSLQACIEVVKNIHDNGGSATPEHLASWLGYAGTNNGAFITKCSATRMFGLMDKQGKLFVPTSLAQRVLSPVFPQDKSAALVEAFLNVELFRRVYNDNKQRDLPQGLGLKNAMRTIYGVLPARIDLAIKTLLDSAGTAGFFAVKGGARTHLIMPMTQAPMAPPHGVAAPMAPPPPAAHGGGNPPPPPPGALADLHPAMQRLLQKLPPVGSEWTVDARSQWIIMATNIFSAAYTQPATETKYIEVNVIEL